MTKGEEAGGEHFFFVKLRTPDICHPEKMPDSQQDGLCKNVSQCLSLIGLLRLFTHPFPPQAHKSQSSPTPSHQWQAHKSRGIAKNFFSCDAINACDVGKHFIIYNILRQ